MKYCATCCRLHSNETEFCPKHGVALERHDEFAIGALVCGRYEIVGKLRSGAISEVFLVRDQKLRDNSQRAMKVPWAHLKEYIACFMNEALNRLSLCHPSILRCYNLETTESGTPVLLMEFIDGDDLRFWMNREPKLQWRHILEIAIDMAGALGYLHSQGIIHCNIAPENVRATGYHPTPLKVLLDFGLAKAAQTISNRTGTAAGGTVWDGSIVAGTLNYMSPEQAIARDMVGPPSDIYSLGVVLFEMLTGFLPYRNIQSADEARALNRTPPETLRRDASIPSGLSALVEDMLNRIPERRPIADEVLRRLKEFRVDRNNKRSETSNVSGERPYGARAF